MGYTASDFERWVGHWNLEDVLPEGTEGEEGLAEGAVLEEIWVDSVVGGVGGDTDAAVVGPGAGVHGWGCRYSNVGVLGTDGGDGVVHVVCATEVEDVGGLERGQWKCQG